MFQSVKTESKSSSILGPELEIHGDVKVSGSLLIYGKIFGNIQSNGTVQTANALSKYVNVKEMKFEKRLKEQNFGDWAGKKISEVWKELKKNTSQHNFSFICPEVSPPKGENFLTILERVSIWLEELHFHDPQTAVIITHAGIIRGTLSFVLGIEPDKVIGIEISHLSLTRLEFLSKTDDVNRGGRFRILAINNKAG